MSALTKARLEARAPAVAEKHRRRRGCSASARGAPLYSFERVPVSDGYRCLLSRAAARLTIPQVLEAMRSDVSFQEALIAELANAPYPAFFWELPPITAGRPSSPFEFATLRSPGLENAVADPRPFAAHLRAAAPEATVTSFLNLRGDARLIVPVGLGLEGDYAHLATFTRTAPRAQQHDLVAAIGHHAQEALSDEPLWISTAGLGVFWLHVRLDATPKYYVHKPYRRRP